MSMTIRALIALAVIATPAIGQHTHSAAADTTHMVGAADATMSGPLSANEMRHMEMSPLRRATRDDSVRARALIRDLRAALAKYSDTSAAVADGYKLFAPSLKNQRVYHFTNYRNAFLEAFRFAADKPTSILYRRGANGRLELIGAMYSAPKRMRLGRLDDRVPLSIAQWHKHINWCLPPKGSSDRWTDRKAGAPVFGPLSPIDTREACEAAGGRFAPSVFGWMVHANVFLGDDLATVFGHEH